MHLLIEECTQNRDDGTWKVVFLNDLFEDCQRPSQITDHFNLFLTLERIKQKVAYKKAQNFRDNITTYQAGLLCHHASCLNKPPSMPKVPSPVNILISLVKKLYLV